MLLGERLAHDAVGHIQLVRHRLGLTVCRDQSVDVVVDIAVAVCPAELLLVLIAYFLRINGVRDAKNVIYQIVLVFVLHDGIPRRSERHLLQTLALLIIGIIAFRSVAKLGVNGVPVLIVAYLLDKGFFLAEFVARKAFHLSCRIVMISNHLAVGIGHRTYAVPAVVGGAIDIGAYVGKARHDRSDGLNDLSLSTVIVGFAARCVFNEHQSPGAVVLLARRTVGVSNAVKEVLGIKHLLDTLVVVGIGNGRLIRNTLFELRRELGSQVARRVVGADHFARVGVIDL